MKRLVTCAQMREVDAAACTEHGMPSAVMMENAGAALAEEALRRVAAGGRILVLCGRGNNGGDGLVAARKLAAQGREVVIEVVGDLSALEGEPRRNLQALQAIGISPTPIPEDLEVSPGDVVIDAVLGTGLRRAPEGAYADALDRIAAFRAQGALVISADLPSGLDGDTGVPFAPCVQADVTLAFGALKVGQAVSPGHTRCGELREVEIGIPAQLLQALPRPGMFLLEEQDARRRLPARPDDSHKGTFGHVLVVAGSWGKTGAAALAGLAALRSGAGLVTVATRPEALVPVLAHAPELMGVELVSDGPLGPSDLNTLLEAADGKGAVVIGPGIPRGPDTARLLGDLLEELTVPCVLDADALNAVAAQPEAVRKAKAPVVLTPHPGEMGRLIGKTAAEVQQDRIGAARVLAAARGALVVLKGARTLICSEDGTIYVCPAGNPGMATAGTGDVLSGVLGALLAQGLSPLDACLLGVFAHARAGDEAAAQKSRVGMVASDLLDGLCEVWRGWEA